MLEIFVLIVQIGNKYNHFFSVMIKQLIHPIFLSPTSFTFQVNQFIQKSDKLLLLKTRLYRFKILVVDSKQSKSIALLSSQISESSGHYFRELKFAYSFFGIRHGVTRI